MYGGEGWLKVRIPCWVLGHRTHDIQLMFLILNEDLIARLYGLK